MRRASHGYIDKDNDRRCSADLLHGRGGGPAAAGRSGDDLPRDPRGRVPGGAGAVALRVPAVAVERLAADAVESGGCVDVAAIAAERRIARDVARAMGGQR